jgi:hypothetical protein
VKLTRAGVAHYYLNMSASAGERPPLMVTFLPDPSEAALK